MGDALGYATEELRGDREVVMTAVAENGYAVADASEALRGDKEIMEAAVASAPAQGSAPVGLKARLNPACLLCGKGGGKAQSHLRHFVTLHNFHNVLKGKGEAFSFFSASAENLKRTCLDS